MIENKIRTICDTCNTEENEDNIVKHNFTIVERFDAVIKKEEVFNKEDIETTCIDLICEQKEKLYVPIVQKYKIRKRYINDCYKILVKDLCTVKYCIEGIRGC
jgi:hypothetical protein